ncbi:HNH endonuclease [Glutamicibacter ardleyensis]|uniref:HNH endonuclease n=1 Tax=Glutamicibacter ardleyensis TaxID=225894 RepID=UPI003FCFB6ED
MTLKDLTDPAAIHQALDLYDRMGREDFLAKYGFGPAKSYWLLRDGRSYDSKAIAGVAHLIQTGTLLERNQFTGGLHGAAKALMNLGFDITPHPNTAEATREGSAFEVLWNPNNYIWDDGDFQDIQNQIQAGASVPFSWSTGPRNQGIAPGDRIYMFHVGSENRGLIASGHAASEIEQHPHFDETRGDYANYVDVSWDTLVSPEGLLSWETIRDHIPEFPKVFMSGGIRLQTAHSEALETLWQNHVEHIALGAAKPHLGQPIEKGYRYYLAKHRSHQRRFRALLLAHYAAECIVCGLDEIAILEAAHLIADADDGLPTVENGRLMCPNHHKAFDTHFFHLDADDNAIWQEGIDEF